MSRYQLYVTPAAWKEIKDLPGHVRQRVRKAVTLLAEKPRPAKSKALKVPDLESEVRVMMDAFQRTIQASHMLMDDLVSVTVYCTDLSAFATFNSIYVQYFQPPYPARAFIGAPKLLLDTHFEIQGIAVKDAHKTKTATPIPG